MIYLDVTSAASSPVNMGVHRTVRGVYQELNERMPAKVLPLCWDFFRKRYGRLSVREAGFLCHPFASYENPQGVPGRWSLDSWMASLADDWNRKSRGIDSGALPGEGDILLIPDLCWDSRIKTWKGWTMLPGKKMAIFHDAMPLNIPGQADSNDKLFREYVCALGHLDQVICISEEVRSDLLRYWKQDGVPAKPTPVVTWPVPFSKLRPENPPNQDLAHIIYVARLKLRKNHLVLLVAAEMLWRQGVRFTLDLIGVEDAFSDTRRILKRVKTLAAQGYPIQWRKHISDVELNEAYKNASFTVFPSQMEGFGLPIIESLWHRRPVICGRNGAIGEVAREGGGCLLIDQNNPEELASAIKNLLQDKDLYSRLYQESVERKFRRWNDYGRDLEALLNF